MSMQDIRGTTLVRWLNLAVGALTTLVVTGFVGEPAMAVPALGADNSAGGAAVAASSARI
jgi:hypothetical protein